MKRGRRQKVFDSQALKKVQIQAKFALLRVEYGERIKASGGSRLSQGNGNFQAKPIVAGLCFIIFKRLSVISRLSLSPDAILTAHRGIKDKRFRKGSDHYEPL